MNSQSSASIETAKSQLRDRIVNTYQRAQRIITVTAASPTANTHASMAAYDKAWDTLRSNVLRASKLFSDTDELLSWLLNELGDDVISTQDRISLALTVRTMTEETKRKRCA
jgi:hypothetical protein